MLSFSGGATDGAIYFYVADDVAFTIAGQNEGWSSSWCPSCPDSHARADRDLPE